MSWWRRALDQLMRRGRDRDLEREIRAHLELEAEEQIQAGQAPAEAPYAARRAFGNVALFKELTREIWGWSSLERFGQDLRYAARMLRKNPGFAVVAVLTLALGTGANTAIFSVVNAVLLRPLPYPQPERLVRLGETDRRESASVGEVSYPNFTDWRAQGRAFENMAAYHTGTFTFTDAGEALQLDGVVVSAAVFQVLGVAPVLGRGFLTREDGPEGQVVILSHEFWEERFGAAPNILGRTLVLDNKSFTVVGVMPKDFEFPIQSERARLWTTFASEAQSTDGKPPVTEERESRYLSVIARLKAGTSVPQAQAEMSAVAGRLEKHYPGPNTNTGVLVVPELEQLVGGSRTTLLVLLGAVVFVMLIACANVANLLLARARTRQKEIAIRAALGAGRQRLIRQLLTESVLLSILGGVLGLLFGTWGIHAILRFAPHVARLNQVALDLRVLAFTSFVSLLTGLLFGLVPARQALRCDLTTPLKVAGPGPGAGARDPMRSVLVVSEVALASVLLVGAGLLIESLMRLLRVNPGFDASNVLTFRVDLPGPHYSAQRRIEFYRELLPDIQAVPGVQSASAIEPLPIGDGNMACSFQIEGRPTPPGEYFNTDFRSIALHYFATMRIPLLNGRDFTARDDLHATPVVMINQSLARRFFPNQDPIGKRIMPATSNGYPQAPLRTIVGVVADVRSRSLMETAKSEVYVPQAQSAMIMTVIVRSDREPRVLIPYVRTALRRLDKNLPVYNMFTLSSYLSGSLAGPRWNALLLGIFASLGLTLAAIGLYGVMSYFVAQRRHEVGIRMALGAQRSEVLRMVVREAMVLVAIGVAFGLLGAVALTRLLSNMLYGIKGLDPLTFISVSVLLAAVGALASYLPARRASRIDPMLALRHE